MKRVLIAAMVALSLGGCAQLSAISGGVSVITKSIENPVTPADLYAVEASLRIVTEALLTYRRACLAGGADKNCRANIVAIQPYTRQINPILIELRDFVRKDDQVNAIVVYNRLTRLYNTLKTSASQLGIPVGA